MGVRGERGGGGVGELREGLVNWNKLGSAEARMVVPRKA